MKKSTLIMILSLVLAVALGVGGTLAYLTDDDGDVNVMTVGNVQITQNEQQRVDQGEENSELEEFEQNKAMAPIVDKGMERIDQDVNGWDITMRDEDTYRNYVDKIVSVTNTGSSNAYVRTLLAFPTKGYDSGELAFDEWLHWNYISDTDTTPNNGWMWGTEENGVEWPNNTKDWNAFYNVEINGEEYTVYIATNEDALAPGKTTAPTLVGMFLDAAVDNELVDGKINYYVTKNGKKFDLGDISKLEVLVLSQAVQADGFDTAWEAFDAAFPATEESVVEWLSTMEIGTPGEKNDTNNPPEFAPDAGDDEDVTFDVPAGAYRVTNATELKDAVAAGETVLLLAAGEYDIDSCTNKNLTLIGEDQEKTIIKVVGGGQGEANGQLDYGFDSSTVTFQNLTIKTNNATYAGYARLKGTYKDVNFDSCYCLNGDSVFEYCTFNVAGNQYNVWTWGAPTATFKNTTFNSDGKAVLLYGRANTKLTLESCLFNDTGVLPDLKAAVEIGNDYNTSYELIVNNTVVNGYEENDKGILTGSTLWANKNSMGSDKLNVVLDGVDIY